MAKSKATKGVVANPRGIPKGTHVLRQGDTLFFAGDKVTKDDIGNWDHLVNAGFIEVSDG